MDNNSVTAWPLFIQYQLTSSSQIYRSPETAAEVRRASPRQIRSSAQSKAACSSCVLPLYPPAISEIPLEDLWNLLTNTKDKSEKQDVTWTGKVEL